MRSRYNLAAAIVASALASACGEFQDNDTAYSAEIDSADSGHDTALAWEVDDWEPIVLSKVTLKHSTGVSFYAPISGLPTYDCKYSSKGSFAYTTLWVDNQDGGAKAKADAAKYPGTHCDTYDAISGRKYEGEFCGSHPGVDISAPKYTPIYAIHAGKVYAVDSAGKGGWGKYIVLEIDAVESGKAVKVYATYAHLDSVDAKVVKGAAVSRAQTLGKTGNTGTSTGPHLHFQLDKSAAASHPYWPASAPNVPDWTATIAGYTWNPLTAIGYGTCY